MTVRINKPAINLREELASMRSLAGVRGEKKFYVDALENGDFSAGTAGWTAYNYKASVSASNGELTVTATGTANGSYAYQRVATKVGKTYKVTATIVTTGQAYLRANLNTIHPWNYDGAMSFHGTANVTKSFTFVASQDHIFLGLGTHNTSVGVSATYSSVTMQEIGENLVTNGTFDNGTTGWYPVSGGDVTGAVVNGEYELTNTAGTPKGSTQTIDTEIGKTYTITAKARVSSGADLYLVASQTNWGFADNLGNVSTSSTSNVELSVTFTATGQQSYVYLRVGGVGVSYFDNITVTEGSHPVIQSIPYGYDVKDVYIDGELAREGEAYDYQVKTDGINQWLKPTVEPTATTETVVIGVRK